jgi:hypothetical protein
VPEQAVLSAKNVLAMKALLNIAHCFGGMLGSAWRLVLEAFEHLDRLLNNLKTKEPTADTNVLSTALAHLFEYSVSLDGACRTGRGGTLLRWLADRPVYCLRRRGADAHGARTDRPVTTRARQRPDLPRHQRRASFLSRNLKPCSHAHTHTQGTPAGNPQLFGLSRVFDTGMHNQSRIMRLWDDLAMHLLDVSSHKVCFHSRAVALRS